MNKLAKGLIILLLVFLIQSTIPAETKIQSRPLVTPDGVMIPVVVVTAKDRSRIIKAFEVKSGTIVTPDGALTQVVTIRTGDITYIIKASEIKSSAMVTPDGAVIPVVTITAKGTANEAHLITASEVSDELNIGNGSRLNLAPLNDNHDTFSTIEIFLLRAALLILLSIGITVVLIEAVKYLQLQISALGWFRKS